MCSRAIFVTTETRGVITFVASSRPPSPTSMTPTCAPRAARSAKAMAVVASKKLASRRSICGWRNVVHSANASSPIGTPSTTMRSRTETRCGEVYIPTLCPRAASSAPMKAQVEPLPFVPATWIEGKWRSGCPSTSRSPSVGPRLHLMRLPCRAKRKREASSKDSPVRISRRPRPAVSRPCDAAAERWYLVARSAARPRRSCRAPRGIRRSGSPPAGPDQSSV